LKGFSQTLPSEEARHEFVTSGVAMDMLSHLKQIRTKLATYSSTPSKEVKAKAMHVLSSKALQRLRRGKVTMKAVHVPKLISFFEMKALHVPRVEMQAARTCSET
jgi:hypothetical protein